MMHLKPPSLRRDLHGYVSRYRAYCGGVFIFASSGASSDGKRASGATAKAHALVIVGWPDYPSTCEVWSGGAVE